MTSYDLPVRAIAILKTRCGCSREITVTTPFPKTLEVPLSFTPERVVRLDDGALLGLFADEQSRRVFFLHDVVRRSPGEVAATYYERGTTVRET